MRTAFPVESKILPETSCPSAENVHHLDHHSIIILSSSKTCFAHHHYPVCSVPTDGDHDHHRIQRFADAAKPYRGPGTICICSPRAPQIIVAKLSRQCPATYSAAELMFLIGMLWMASSTRLQSTTVTWPPLSLIIAFAAIVHDFDHPGVNNDFLIKTKHALALTHNVSAHCYKSSMRPFAWLSMMVIVIVSLSIQVLGCMTHESCPTRQYAAELERYAMYQADHHQRIQHGQVQEVLIWANPGKILR